MQSCNSPAQQRPVLCGTALLLALFYLSASCDRGVQICPPKDLPTVESATLPTIRAGLYLSPIPEKIFGGSRVHYQLLIKKTGVSPTYQLSVNFNDGFLRGVTPIHESLQFSLIQGMVKSTVPRSWLPVSSDRANNLRALQFQIRRLNDGPPTPAPEESLLISFDAIVDPPENLSFPYSVPNQANVTVSSLERGMPGPVFNPDCDGTHDSMVDADTTAMIVRSTASSRLDEVPSPTQFVVSRCTPVGGCPAENPFCGSTGYCTSQCVNDAQCPSDRTRCEPDLHFCVACYKAEHCISPAGDGLRCLTESNTCGCYDSKDCQDNLPCMDNKCQPKFSFETKLDFSPNNPPQAGVYGQTLRLQFRNEGPSPAPNLTVSVPFELNDIRPTVSAIALGASDWECEENRLPLSTKQLWRCRLRPGRTIPAKTAAPILSIPIQIALSARRLDFVLETTRVDPIGNRPTAMETISPIYLYDERNAQINQAGCQFSGFPAKSAAAPLGPAAKGLVIGVFLLLSFMWRRNSVQNANSCLTKRKPPIYSAIIGVLLLLSQTSCGPADRILHIRLSSLENLYELHVYGLYTESNMGNPQNLPAIHRSDANEFNILLSENIRSPAELRIISIGYLRGPQRVATANKNIILEDGTRYPIIINLTMCVELTDSVLNGTSICRYPSLGMPGT